MNTADTNANKHLNAQAVNIRQIVGGESKRERGRREGGRESRQ